MLVIIRVWAHVWEGLIDRVERDQLSRPEWCAGDVSEPLIGQRHLILPLIGRDQHFSTGNDSIKNLYNLVRGTVVTLSCGDIMQIKHWWMDHCSVLTEARWRVRTGELGAPDTDTGWKLVTPPLSSAPAQSLSRLQRHAVSGDHMTQTSYTLWHLQRETWQHTAE